MNNKSIFDFNDNRLRDGFFILIFFSLIFYFVPPLFESSYNNFIKDYKMVETNDQLLIEVEWIDNQHGYTYIRSKNDEKLIFPPTYNNSYVPEFFGEMISEGDSIIKMSNSDIFCLKRNNIKYRYTIGQKLRNNL
jgi:hypothetical protein